MTRTQMEALLTKARENPDFDLGEIVNDFGHPNISIRFNAYAQGYFIEARTLCKAKEKDYGSTWAELGLKGIYIYLKAKAGRLKNLVWWGNPAAVAGESIRDTLIDMLNYILFALYLLDTNNWDGRENNGE